MSTEKYKFSYFISVLPHNNLQRYFFIQISYLFPSVSVALKVEHKSHLHEKNVDAQILFTTKYEEGLLSEKTG